MKKKLFFAFFGLFIFSAFLNAQSLDEAIIGAALKISRDLPANTTAAIINFRSDSEKLNDYVVNELYGAILRNRSIVPVKPDPVQLQSIRGDLPSDMTDTVGRESAQRIGRLLGAQYLVTGSTERVGSEYKINFNAIDTNAELKSRYSVTLNPQNDSQFALLLGIKTESNSAAASTKTQKRKQQEEIKNWVSFNAAFVPFFDTYYFSDIHNSFGIGVSISYEYMLNPKISLGANIYLNYMFFSCYLIFGIDAAFRFYPWGKTFFIGTALGLCDEVSDSGDDFGVGIIPEIGWKIDVGEKGGGFIQTGITVTYMSQVTMSQEWDSLWVYLWYPRIYFGIGYAF